MKHGDYVDLNEYEQNRKGKLSWRDGLKVSKRSAGHYTGPSDTDPNPLPEPEEEPFEI